MAIRYPNVMKAPGGKMKSSMFVVSGKSRISNTEPAPNSSRTMPSNVRATVNPRPMPTPSIMLSKAPCLQAKASARPKITQFTTMSGIYSPSEAFTAGRYAAKHICSTVTNEAITTTNTGMRTMSGVRFLMSDMATLEQISTNIVASPIDKPLMADVVVANVGHMPNNKTNVGFSFIKPLYINFKLFIVNVFLKSTSVSYLLMQLLRGTRYSIGLRRLHILTISAEGIIHGPDKSL